MNVYLTAVLVLSVTVAVLSDPITTVKPASKAADDKKDAANSSDKKDPVKPSAKSDSATAGKKEEAAVKSKTVTTGKKEADKKKPTQAPAKVAHAPAKQGEKQMMNDQPAGKDSGKPKPKPKASKGEASTKAPSSAVTDPAKKKGSGKRNDATSCFVNSWKIVVAMTTIAVSLSKI